MKIIYNSMYKYYLNLKLQVLLRYHRNWTKKVDNVANSSGVLSLEILHAKIVKDQSQLLLSENELKIIECIKKNVLIDAKDIIEETKIPDRTVRRIFKR